MSQSAATEQALGELHTAIAHRITTEINKDEIDPRFIQAGIKFLSDNKITCVAHKSNALGELERNLNRRKTRFGKAHITDLATKRAKEQAKEAING